MFRLPFITLLGAIALFAISCTPKETQELLAPENALGTVLAEQTARLAGANRQVIIISADASWGPASTAETAFRAALKKQNLTVLASQGAVLGDPMKSGTIGLKAADFFDVVEKNPSAGAIVSFAGAPLFESSDVAKLTAAHPPILVVATATLGNVPGVPGKQPVLAGLIEANYIQLAIIDGQGKNSAPDGKTDATHALFDEHFQILRSADTAAH